MNKTISGRYDLFRLIHKGLRAMLYSTGMSVQHNDFNNRQETLSLFDKINEMLLVTEDHASHENRFVLPLLARYNIMTVKDFESDHVSAESLCNQLKNLMALYLHAVNDDELEEGGRAICRSFNEFMTFSMQHMNKEDDVLNKLLWKFYSDNEIRCIYKTIAESIPADKVMMHGRWVMRGINNKEIINWLLSYHSVHPGAFQFLLQLAEDELPENRWNDIQEALCEGEMTPCGCES